uniref:Uncharacterized protein n=1 Tax=Panagrolaimus davidi TaxID=227884 RepID=A0A914PRB8_9BILA
MKGVFIIFVCFISVSLVSCRTIGQKLDATIEQAGHVKDVVTHPVRYAANKTAEIVDHTGQVIRGAAVQAGQVITAPVRYVGTKAQAAVESTRNAAGGIVAGAGNTLKHAGESLKGSETLNQPENVQVD